MATKIVTKNSSTAGSAPSASDLVQGELAVNVVDKRLYTENNSGAIVELGTNPAGAVTMASTLQVDGAATFTTEITANGGIALGDSDKATFGAGDDLAIYSTGANGFIENEVGLLILKNNSDDRDIALQSDNGSGGIANYLLADGSTGALKAYHYGSEKLATTATGIDVTGTATMDGLVSSGNAGIGTSSPSAPLDVDRSFSVMPVSTTTIGNRRGLSIYNNQSNGFVDTTLVYGNTVNSYFALGHHNGTSYAERMRIDSSGKVGIGTASPTFTLEVNGGGAADNLKVESQSTLTNFYQTTTGGTTVFQNNNGNMAMFTGGSERMRIDSIGLVKLNTTDTLGRLSVSSGGNTTGIGVTQSSSTVNHTGLAITNAYVNGGQTGVMIRFIQTSGATVGTIQSTINGTAYNTSSDQRLKENIADADDAGSKIDSIQVRKYDWKVDGSHQDYGMVAQELQAVAPEAVSGDADSEEMMGVDYSKLVPMLIKEIQSLRQRVASLEE